MTSPFSLEGKAALVTGANQGLGKAFAFGLAEAGARVAISGRREEANLAAAAEAEKAEFDFVTITADITDDAQVSAMTEGALSVFDGRIDILVNNAGTCYHAPAFEQTDEQWANVFDLNVRALWKTLSPWVPSCGTAVPGRSSTSAACRASSSTAHNGSPRTTRRRLRCTT
jgi:NAD(P)-dependent dehydrogenase (short-subunit alcohol dehydrogenase family)